MTVWVRAGERVYRGLLRLYPSDFRDPFSEEMVQLFHDKLRDAHAGGASMGAATAWLSMIGDVTVTATAERMRRNRTVAHSLSAAPPLRARALGIVGIVGGAALLAAFVIQIPGELNAFRIIIFNLGAIAVMLGVHRRQAAAAPALAAVVTGLAVLANGWYAVMIVIGMGRSGPMTADFGNVLFWAGLALWITDGMFGLLALWLRTVTRWGALALVVGAPLALTGISVLGLTSAEAPTIFNTLSQVGIIMVGIGWILLGIDVATRRVPGPATP